MSEVHVTGYPPRGIRSTSTHTVNVVKTVRSRHRRSLSVIAYSSGQPCVYDVISQAAASFVVRILRLGVGDACVDGVSEKCGMTKAQALTTEPLWEKIKGALGIALEEPAFSSPIERRPAKRAGSFRPESYVDQVRYAQVRVQICRIRARSEINAHCLFFSM